MSKKIQCDHLYGNVGKYDFEYNKYVLPVIRTASAELEHREIYDSKAEKLINPRINLEPFKTEYIPIKPEICTYAFMSELEVTEVKNEEDLQKLIEILENKLNKILIKGTSKKLLIELFISIIKFSNKYSYDIPQTGAILAIFYNTHLFLSYNLFATPEEVYEFFTEYIYYHSISVPPYRTKIFDPKEAHRVVMYFCSTYLRNLPLVRLLMFPNYGLLLKTKNPVTEEELIGKKGKGKDKGKKEPKEKKEKKGKK